MNSSSDGNFRWKPGDREYMNQFRDDSHHLYIKDKEGSNALRNTRNREIYKSISTVIPNIKACKQLQSGEYLLKIPRSDVETTLKVTEIGSVPVRIVEADYINQTKVTIYHEDFTKYTDDKELLEDLQSRNNNITNAEIRKIWKNNNLTNTEIAVVTINEVIPYHELKSKKVN